MKRRIISQPFSRHIVFGPLRRTFGIITVTPIEHSQR